MGTTLIDPITFIFAIDGILGFILVFGYTIFRKHIIFKQLHSIFYALAAGIVLSPIALFFDAGPFGFIGSVAAFFAGQFGYAIGLAYNKRKV